MITENYIMDVSKIDAAFLNPPTIITARDQENKEVVRIEQNGRISWNGREVETDDEFRGAMMELRNTMMRSMRGASL